MMALLFLILCWSNSSAGSLEFIKSTARKLILGQLKLPDAAIEVEFGKEDLGLIASFEHPSSCSKVDLFKLGQSTFSLNLTAQTGHKLVVAGSYKCFRKLPVAAKKILKGSSIKRHQVQLVETVLDPTEKPLELEAILGMEAEETIYAGTPIKAELLIKPVMVRAGELVELLVAEKNIRIRTSCICLESGRIGETVRLKNPKTNKAFLGIVDGPKIVKLHKDL